MAFYDKDDMIYQDYNWSVSPGDNPNITGKVDRDKLSKREGYEVLDFINHIAKEHNLKKKTSGNKIEKMLRHKDISSVHSREKIEKWIVDNWSNH